MKMKRLTLVVSLLALIFAPFDAGFALDPAPNIKAFGLDGPIAITRNENIPVTVELNSGSRFGANADWWVAASTPFDWYYYDVIEGSWSWKPGLSVTAQTTLFDLTSTEVLNISGLPEGKYTFYFGVDMTPNEVLDMDQLYYDSVTVSVGLDVDPEINYTYNISQIAPKIPPANGNVGIWMFIDSRWDRKKISVLFDDIADWRGREYQNKKLLEPINVVWIDYRAITEQEAKDRVALFLDSSGFFAERWHTENYHGLYLKGEWIWKPQYPVADTWVDAWWPDESNHGRVFPAVNVGSDKNPVWITTGAFSRESACVIGDGRGCHDFVSFNLARDALFDFNWDPMGVFDFGNEIRPGVDFWTADHDGVSVFALLDALPRACFFSNLGYYNYFIYKCWILNKNRGLYVEDQYAFRAFSTTSNWTHIQNKEHEKGCKRYMVWSDIVDGKYAGGGKTVVTWSNCEPDTLVGNDRYDYNQKVTEYRTSTDNCNTTNEQIEDYFRAYPRDELFFAMMENGYRFCGTTVEQCGFTNYPQEPPCN